MATVNLEALAEVAFPKKSAPKKNKAATKLKKLRTILGAKTKETTEAAVKRIVEEQKASKKEADALRKEKDVAVSALADLQVSGRGRGSRDGIVIRIGDPFTFVDQRNDTQYDGCVITGVRQYEPDNNYEPPWASLSGFRQQKARMLVEIESGVAHSSFPALNRL